MIQKMLFIVFVFAMSVGIGLAQKSRNWDKIDKRITTCIANNMDIEVQKNLVFHFWCNKMIEYCEGVIKGGEAYGGKYIVLLSNEKKNLYGLVELADKCETLAQVKEQLTAIKAIYEESLKTETNKRIRENPNSDGNVFETDEIVNLELNTNKARKMRNLFEKIQKILDI
ncbi:MAG: hypothetical protein NZ551_10260 [Microscillaceae bacterium]|nr:hypothetical protein [Microscillaceae bacterium]MDW8461580.1 hypothetical protein [Cytophagales bacterium]